MHCQGTISAYHLWERSHGKFVLNYIISVIFILLKISTVPFVLEKNNEQNLKNENTSTSLQNGKGSGSDPSECQETTSVQRSFWASKELSSANHVQPPIPR